jgi:hypothetical protein
MEPKIQSLSTTLCNSSISIKLEYKDLGFSFNILNIYGPYSYRINYWGQLAHSRALSESHMLIDNDLNLTLSLREIWGANP